VRRYGASTVQTPGEQAMDEKGEWELRLKVHNGIPLTISEEKELFPENFQPIPRLSPQQRVSKLEAICNWLGVKPSQIVGHIIKKHKPPTK
jgi:hypothetical protein